MLLKKIILDNYGLYSGKVEFDLAPKTKYGKQKPIVLFGGHNGAGKTTLFDAFKVCLYGKTALGNRVSQTEYEAFLRGRVHRSPSQVLQPQGASISLDFDFTILGETKNYLVERSWINGTSKGVKESLYIECDGVKVENVNKDFWQGFFEEVIPQRLSSLFFFDGEKIKSIADDAHGNEALSESIKTLLGLDVVERLKSDLSIYKTREAAKHSKGNLKSQIIEYENIVSSLGKARQTLVEELAANQTKLDGILNRIKATELKLHREGSTYAGQREALITRKSELHLKLEETKRAVRDECESVYPFSLCPTIAADLKLNLENEQANKRKAVIGDELEQLRTSIISDKNAEKFDSDSSKELFKKLVDGAFAARINELGSPAEILFGFSDSDTNQIVNWIDQAQAISKPKVEKLKNSYEQFSRDLQKIQNEIEKAPSDAILKPYVEELNSLNNKQGMLQQERIKLNERASSLANQQREAERKLERTVSILKSNEDTEQRIETVNKLQPALDDYIARLTKAKVEELRTTVADCFNRISRKEDLLSQIDIDPETFAVTLLDRHGRSLPKEDLSAGEKQMYAVAMLWGLSITSGRPLPVIIDTPLGRLDSEHRRKLINNYFPMASEQVLIFSTDTEIDQQWYKELSSNISHCYHLSYDSKDNKTIVSNQYFWR